MVTNPNLYSKNGKRLPFTPDSLERALTECKHGVKYETNATARRRAQLDDLRSTAIEAFAAYQRPQMASIGQRWESMSEVEKKPYHRLADRDGYRKMRCHMLANMHRREIAENAIERDRLLRAVHARANRRAARDQATREAYTVHVQRRGLKLREQKRRLAMIQAERRRRQENIKSSLYREANDVTGRDGRCIKLTGSDGYARKSGARSAYSDQANSASSSAYDTASMASRLLPSSASALHRASVKCERARVRNTVAREMVRNPARRLIDGGGWASVPRNISSPRMQRIGEMKLKTRRRKCHARAKLSPGVVATTEKTFSVRSSPRKSISRKSVVRRTMPQRRSKRISNRLHPNRSTSNMSSSASRINRTTNAKRINLVKKASKKNGNNLKRLKSSKIKNVKCVRSVSKANNVKSVKSEKSVKSAGSIKSAKSAKSVKSAKSANSYNSIKSTNKSCVRNTKSMSGIGKVASGRVLRSNAIRGGK